MHKTMTIPVLAAALAAGCATPQQPESTGPTMAPVAAPVTQVAEVDWVSHVEAGGTVQARSTAHVTSRVVAPVDEVHVRPGDRVAQGGRLVTLDARALTAQAAQATAAATAATAASRAAASREAAASSALALASATFARIDALHARDSATPQERDHAVAARDTADAQLTAARSDRAAADANRLAAEASSEAAQVAESYAVLTAPFDAIVAERLVDAGSLATPGTPLLVLEEVGSPRLEVVLDDSAAGTIQVGQQADVRLDANEAWLDATISEISRADRTTHSFLVKLDLPTAAPARTGAFGRARFAGATRRALAVPSSSLVERGQLTFVFVVEPGGVARLRPVRRGTADGDRTEIVAGLMAGDRIISVPPPGLADGQPIEGQP